MSSLFQWGQDQALARRHDPVTSFEAADSLEGKIPALEAEVLKALKSHGGLTTEELAYRMGMSLVTISPRLAPLFKKGKVRKNGTRKNQSGRNAIIWEISD